MDYFVWTGEKNNKRNKSTAFRNSLAAAIALKRFVLHKCIGVKLAMLYI